MTTTTWARPGAHSLCASSSRRARSSAAARSLAVSRRSYWSSSILSTIRWASPLAVSLKPNSTAALEPNVMSPTLRSPLSTSLLSSLTTVRASSLASLNARGFPPSCLLPIDRDTSNANSRLHVTGHPHVAPPPATGAAAAVVAAAVVAAVVEAGGWVQTAATDKTRDGEQGRALCRQGRVCARTHARTHARPPRWAAGARVWRRSWCSSLVWQTPSAR